MSRGTKLMRAREVMRQLRTGPAALVERSCFTPGGDAGEEARKALFDQYQLWVSTWVLPELEHLIPELRDAARKSETACAAMESNDGE